MCLLGKKMKKGFIKILILVICCLLTVPNVFGTIEKKENMKDAINKNLIYPYRSKITPMDVKYTAQNKTLSTPFIGPEKNSVIQWPQQGLNAQHIGRSPYSTVYNQDVEKWRLPCDWSYGSPVIDANGTIYFFADGLYAVYPNGTLKWKYKALSVVGNYGAHPAVADDGTVYIPIFEGDLYAVNPNGTRKWSCDTPEIGSSITIGDDGLIYYGHEQGLDARYPNGTLKWTFHCGEVQSSPAVDEQGIIYFGGIDSENIYALYPNGTMKWNYTTGAWVHGSPTIASDNTVYCGSDDGYLYAFFPNGTLKWKTYIDSGMRSSPSLDKTGNMYFGVWDSFIMSVAPNGAIRWKFLLSTGDSVWGPTAAISDDGTVFIGNSIDFWYLGPGEIIALDLNGTLKWRKTITPAIGVYSSPVIAADGSVYIVSNWPGDAVWGYLHAFGRGMYEADAHGPYYELTNTHIQFNGEVRNGSSPYQYHWNFGDGNTSDIQNPTHMYTKSGNYTLTLTVIDKNGNTTNDTSWVWVQITNSAPQKPVITGPNVGKKEIEYPFNFSSIDLDGSIVYYYIKWGDLSNTDWIGPYNSGEQINKTHTWSLKLKFTIQVKAKDPYGAESDWSSFNISITDISLRMVFRLFYATIIIQNTGMYDLYNVPWKIRTYEDIGGIILHQSNNTAGTIPRLKALSAERIRIFIIGYGLVEVDMFVYNERVAREAWMLGPLFIPTFG
jgi:PKD repeat protein